MERTLDEQQPLRGKRILIADDEFLIVATIEDTLRDAGADTVAALESATALKMAGEERLSAAILDVSLGRHSIEAVADALAARNVPFMFYSGQEPPDRLRAKYPHAKLLLKPARQCELIEAIAETSDGRALAPS